MDDWDDDYDNYIYDDVDDDDYAGYNGDPVHDMYVDDFYDEGELQMDADDDDEKKEDDDHMRHLLEAGIVMSALGASRDSQRSRPQGAPSSGSRPVYWGVVVCIIALVIFALILIF